MLGVDDESVRPSDNFFRVGGDSLNSLRLAAEANRRGLKLTIKMIFEHPTLAELALELPDAVALHGGMCAAAAPLGGAPRARRWRRAVSSDRDHARVLCGLHIDGINPQIYFEWERKGRCAWPSAGGTECVRGPPPRMAASSLPMDDEGAVGAELPDCRGGGRRAAAARPSRGDGDGPRPDTWPLFDCRLTHDAGGGRSVVHLCASLFIMDGILTSRCAGSPRCTTISMRRQHRSFCTRILPLTRRSTARPACCLPSTRRRVPSGGNASVSCRRRRSCRSPPPTARRRAPPAASITWAACCRRHSSLSCVPIVLRRRDADGGDAHDLRQCLPSRGAATLCSTSSTASATPSTRTSPR